MKESELSKWADEGLGVLNQAVTDAVDRKRRPGQYWVVWDGERPVKVYPKIR